MNHKEILTSIMAGTTYAAAAELSGYAEQTIRNWVKGVCVPSVLAFTDFISAFGWTVSATCRPAS